ncbi:MAG: hypothetical protein AMJ78_10630 [Omnitrophica WOR_2 bacterium SM23_29]|nr:MAG: hypothetical protein AMJ78_10630 [Omnitrophica WOR_2 bacterium SM23_29]
MPEAFQRINWVDIFVVILLIRTSYIGARTGFSTELFKSIGVLVGLYLSMRFYSDFGSLIISKIALPPELSDGLSFLILILISVITLKYVGFLLSKVVRLTFADKVDHWGGFIFGVLRGTVLLSLIFMFFGFIQIDYITKSIEERSLTGPYIQRIAPFVYQVITKTSSEDLGIKIPPKEGEKK